MKLREVDELIEEQSDGYENYRGPTSFYFCCVEDGCHMDKPHPNAFSFSISHSHPEEIEFELESNRVDEKIKFKAPQYSLVGLGNALCYFQKKVEGYCMQPDHPTLYSSSQDRYFCPFCRE